MSIALDIKNEQVALRGWREVKSINLEKFLLSIEGLKINSITLSDILALRGVQTLVHIIHTIFVQEGHNVSKH